MYYAEKTIDGIIHYQHGPNGEWHPISLKEACMRLNEIEAKLNKLADRVTIKPYEESDF